MLGAKILKTMVLKIFAPAQCFTQQHHPSFSRIGKRKPAHEVGFSGTSSAGGFSLRQMLATLLRVAPLLKALHTPFRTFFLQVLQSLVRRCRGHQATLRRHLWLRCDRYYHRKRQ
jgi:hypothetical protein